MDIQDVQSPLPGTFYRRPAPGAALFAEEGSAVQAGDVLGLIEVMKQFSEIAAECSGTLLSFHVDDGETVEAGQVLARIQPA